MALTSIEEMQLGVVGEEGLLVSSVGVTSAGKNRPAYGSTGVVANSQETISSPSSSGMTLPFIIVTPLTRGVQARDFLHKSLGQAPHLDSPPWMAYLLHRRSILGPG
jgi:hypothetical protein